MHFFNPPALMKLVEVVAGERHGRGGAGARPRRSPSAWAARRSAAPTRPGFIVNRCNRPFALESLRMLGEGIADATTQIDRDRARGRRLPDGAVRAHGPDRDRRQPRGRAVVLSHSVREPRWQPHPIQEQMVAEGRLGPQDRRAASTTTSDGKRVEPAPRRSSAPSCARAVARARRSPSSSTRPASPSARASAAPDDIDTAMRLGLNHPRGPFEWARRARRRAGAQRPSTRLRAASSATSGTAPRRCCAAGSTRRRRHRAAQSPQRAAALRGQPGAGEDQRQPGDRRDGDLLVEQRGAVDDREPGRQVGDDQGARRADRGDQLVEDRERDPGADDAERDDGGERPEPGRRRREARHGRRHAAARCSTIITQAATPIGRHVAEPVLDHEAADRVAEPGEHDREPAERAASPSRRGRRRAAPRPRRRRAARRPGAGPASAPPGRPRSRAAR